MMTTNFIEYNNFLKPGMINRSYSRELQKLVCVFYKIGSSPDSLKKERPDLFRASIFPIPATIKFHQGQGPRQSGLVKVTGSTPAFSRWRFDSENLFIREIWGNFLKISQLLNNTYRTDFNTIVDLKKTTKPSLT